MTKLEIAQHIDHTVLKPFTSVEMVETICREAIQYKMKGVCVPPSFVPLVKELLDNHPINIVTVVGFPFGYNSSTTKIFECEDSIFKGAIQIDVVNNLGWTIEGKYDLIKEELLNCTKVIHSNNAKIKWIIESGELTLQQIENLINIANEVGIDYLKTSTGYSSIGAELEKVSFMRAKLNTNIGIKASGGIKTKQQFMSFLEAGADIIGTSSSVAIINE